MTASEMSFEEMERIVDERREYDFWEDQRQNEAWRAEQRAKAPVILALLGRHLPPQVLRDVEDYLSHPYSSECLHQSLSREQKRRALLVEHPDWAEGEVEHFLDKGVWRSKEELALRRSEFEAAVSRGELPFL